MILQVGHGRLAKNLRRSKSVKTLFLEPWDVRCILQPSLLAGAPKISWSTAKKNKKGL